MSLLSWLGATALTALLVHVLVLRALPTLVLVLVLRKLEGAGDGIGETNRFAIAPRITEKNRAVVRPCPDLLYAAAFYDVSTQPLQITAPVPETDWSIAFYAMNTENFYAVHDRQAAENPVKIVLAAKGTSPTAAEGVVVEAETSRGVIWIRALIDDESKVEEYLEALRHTTTSPLPGAEGPIVPPA